MDVQNLPLKETKRFNVLSFADVETKVDFLIVSFTGFIFNSTVGISRIWFYTALFHSLAGINQYSYLLK